MSHLQSDRVRASELKTQIRDLERALSVLRAEKYMIQARLDSYKYPVLTLPNEITSEIFVHSLPVYPACPPLTGIHSPTNLTHICRQWRRIALATPMLWRAISLELDEDDAASAQQLHQLDIWQSRSGCFPISLTVKGEGDCRSVFSPTQSARWEVLTVTVPFPPLPVIATSMPALRYLDLAIDDDRGPNGLTVFGEAPLLRSVILNYFAARVVILPWAQLTSLRLDRMYPRECVPVLQQTPNLIHCHLGVLSPLDDDNDWPEVTLLHLESLVLLPFSKGDWDPEIIPGYLETFFVPALRRLHTVDLFLHKSNPVDSLKSFISESGCKPQAISILLERQSITASAYRQAFPLIHISFDGRYGEELDRLRKSKWSTIDTDSVDAV
ncbi:hypothetical protein C8R46DRAFT_1223525 [Mycena filopes]|nr:hypothetical protein C8R46DRAFT_1223525 [Mycena filopes]